MEHVAFKDLLEDLHEHVNALRTAACISMVHEDIDSPSSPGILIREADVQIREAHKLAEELRLLLEQEQATVRQMRYFRDMLDAQGMEIESVADTIKLDPSICKTERKKKSTLVSHSSEGSKKKVNSATSKKKRSSKATTAPVDVPSIGLLSEEEFRDLPSHIRGRLRVDKVNDVIEAMQKLLVEKYMLLSGSSAKLNMADLKQYQTYMEQESPETEGRYFLTDSDLRQKSRVRFDSTTGKAMLNILKHTHRLKHISGAKLTRYLIEQ